MNLQVTMGRKGGSPGNPHVYIENTDSQKKLATIYGPVATRFDLAHMFAAAPEMRASLDELITIFDGDLDWDSAVVERARTALMKANGAQHG